MASSERRSPTSRQRRRYWVWRGLGLLAGVFVLVVVLLPFWFPAVLARVLDNLGVDAASVRPAGYATIRLQEVHFQAGVVELRAREVLLPQPTALLWHRCFSWRQTADTLIHVTDWQVRVESSASNLTPKAAAVPLRVGATLDQVARQLITMGKWLPPLELREGKLLFGEREIQMPAGRWQPGKFTVAAHLAPLGLDAEAALEIHSDRRFMLELRERSQRVRLGLTLRAEGEHWELTGGGSWRSNDFTLRASVGRDTIGPWPEKFEFALPEFRLTAETIGLPGYADVVGGVRLAGGGAEYDLRAWGTAGPSEPGLPSARVELAAHLTPDEIRLDRLEGRSSPVQLALSRPVAWRWRTRQFERPCEFHVNVDLAAQPWGDARGSVRGDLTLTSGPGRYPQAELRLAGEGLEVYGLPIQGLDMTGRAVGAAVERLDLNAGLADGSAVQLTARGLDLTQRTLAEGTLDLALPQGLPEASRLPVALRSAKATVAFHGALTNLEHRGVAMLSGLKLRNLAPADVACHWDGDRERRVAPQIKLSTADGQIELAGVLENLSRFTLTTLAVRSFDEKPLVLEAPAQVQFNLATATNGAATWRLETSWLALTNAQRQVALAAALNWPASVRFNVGLTNLDTAFFRAFMDHDLPTATVETLAAHLDCAGGPADWELTATGRFEVHTNLMVRAAAALNGDARGVRIADLRLRGDEAEEMRLEGALPVFFGRLEGGRFWELRRTAPVNARFTLDAGRSLEGPLREWADVSCRGPKLSGAISGSLASPAASVHVATEAIEPHPDSPWAGLLPRLERLELDLRVETNGLVLDPLTLQVEGAPVTASASLAVTPAFWEGITLGRVNVDWAGLSSRLEVTNLPLGSVASRLAPWLRPEGRLDAGVRLRPGWRWEGGVDIAGLGTRPLPLVGPLRDLRGRLTLQDQQLRVDALEADVGGATARLRGWLNLPTNGVGRGTLPPFALELTGQTLPLARQAGLVVRGDLDLQLRHEGTNTPALEGTVTLGRSFLLSDLKDLFGNSVQGTDRPPPFFALETEPFASWRLGVDIRGDEFLHLKSPFYQGVHSVNLKLRGTLKTPLLLGDARVVRGNVVFPYATLPLSQGIVAFTEADPAHPRLQVRATARAFGYEVRMEIGGSLAEPTVQFSSSPPLTSEEILLMLAAGELPRHQVQYTTTERLAKLASILGKDLLRKFGSQDAGEDRLIIRSGEGISTGGRVTHRIEYRFTDAWSLVGEYDEFDALNAGVKWRILRR